jgi:hypothetical protein
MAIAQSQRELAQKLSQPRKVKRNEHGHIVGVE